MAFQLFTITCLLLLLPLINLPVFVTSIDQNSSPFRFLINLQGLQVGDTAQEITQLIKYLQQFGYLSKTSEIQDTNNVLDKNIAYAIETYQKFHKLKPTGNLDMATVSMMMRPRCGFIDKMLQTSNNFSHPLYVYFDDGARWPENKRSLTYAFPPGIDQAVKPPVASAFEKWRSVVPDFNFTLIDDYFVADLKLSFQRGDHGDGYPFDGPNGILAHALEPPGGVLHFDADETFVVDGNTNGYDLGTVALHEIGHLLGLFHSTNEEAIMYPSIPYGTTKDLALDDIQGIKNLYNQ